VISTDAALARILALIGPLPGEDVALADAAGRVLAAPARADRAQPAFAASAMDGYATRLADAVPGARLRVIDTAQAGQAATRPVEPGTAIRIFTGAPMPTGADRVVIQEDTTAEGDWVTLADNPGDGPHVRPIGADFAAGFTLDPPRRLRPADIALLAAMNLGRVSVTRRPVVALIATGTSWSRPASHWAPTRFRPPTPMVWRRFAPPKGQRRRSCRSHATPRPISTGPSTPRRRPISWSPSAARRSGRMIWCARWRRRVASICRSGRWRCAPASRFWPAGWVRRR
jgi:hypothetical protein